MPTIWHKQIDWINVLDVSHVHRIQMVYRQAASLRWSEDCLMDRYDSSRSDDIRSSDGTILVNVVMKGSITRKWLLSIKVYKLN